MDGTEVFEWPRRCKVWYTSVESDERCGHPSWSRVDEVIAKVRGLVTTDRRLTFKEVAKELDISVGSCSANLTRGLGTTRVSMKFVLLLPTADRMSTACL